jgi:hypothetical protein
MPKIYLRIIDENMQLILLAEQQLATTSCKRADETYERNSSADLRTAVISARSSWRKIASLPVTSFSSAIAAFALAALRAAR